MILSGPVFALVHIPPSVVLQISSDHARVFPPTDVRPYLKRRRVMDTYLWLFFYLLPLPNPHFFKVLESPSYE